MTNMYNWVNYTSPTIKFVMNYIREYDLSKANISALLYTRRISMDEYNKYLIMDKQEREKQIGLMIRSDDTVYENIQEGIIKAKELLSKQNSLEDSDILSIKNDAMFIIGKELKHTSFPPFTFKLKNVYQVYLKLQELEVYYADDQDGTQVKIDIKGIPDKTLELHKDGMLDLICETCYRMQRENPRETLTWISSVYRSFINRRMPKEYYRNFDSFSYYEIPTFTMMASLKDISNDMIPYININRNLSILRDLVGIVTDFMYRR